MPTSLFARLSEFQLANPMALKAMFDELLTQVEEQYDLLQTQITDLTAVVDAIANMESDDVLTPVEKSNWVFQHSVLTGEQAGLDAQADDYGITTEKDAYDDAIDALVAHLATLTTPVAWNDFSGNTDIVGADFRDYFSDVLIAKQALVDAIAAAAKVLADDAAADAAAAQSTANTAQTTANTANTTANTVKINDKISASWISPSSVLTAADVGSDCTITIAAHSRKYGDNTSVSVSGGTVTGLNFSTEYHVYYTDATASTTTPTYLASTNPNTAANNAASGRHYVGSITTPADGAAGTSGTASKPPGYTGAGSIP